MFNLFSKAKSSTPVLELDSCTHEVTEGGIRVTMAQPQSKAHGRPRTFAAALWQSRGQLVESDLATAYLADLADATDAPSEDWSALQVPFESLTYLKEGFAVPAAEALMPEVFDPLVSDLLPAMSEWTLKIEPDINVLTSADLRLNLSFWQSGQQVYPKRLGPWLTHLGQASLLNETQWHLCRLVEAFNAREDKGAETNFSTLAQLYEKLGLKDGSNVRLEAILEDTVILAPSRMTVGWQADSDHPNATQSAYPVLLNSPVIGKTSQSALEEAFRQEFFKYDKAQPTYSLPALPGHSEQSPKKIRILLPPALQDAATHMRRSMRGLSKSVAQAMAIVPEAQFEGVCAPDAIALDLSTYGPRVTGLGPLVFRPVLKVRTLDRISLLNEDWARMAADEHADSPVYLEIQAQNGNGDMINTPIPNDKEYLERTTREIEAALTNHKSSIAIQDIHGNEVLTQPTPQLVSQFQEACRTVHAVASKATAKSTAPESPGQHDRHLSLLSNEDQSLYNEVAQGQFDMRPMLERFDRPNALVGHLSDGNALQLAQYQQEGIAWLQTAFLSGKPGVLLADDMGLGKTLQVLSFLAWMFESGWANWKAASQDNCWTKIPIADSISPGQQHVINPHPVLVVVPKMLMDNWQSEIKKFFCNEGDLFTSFEVLDSKTIKKYTLLNHQKGNDFKTGQPNLNLHYLQSNRLVIANYDTVKNYYHSFAKIAWSCLVMDESQEIKNPGTAVTHAMSCIASKARFKITMTGTPIENDLMDLWSLFDVTAPGLLGSAKDFKQRYYLEERAGTSHGWALDRLKETLGCRALLKEAQATSFVLGRNKKDFLGSELPAIVDVGESEVSPEYHWPEGVEASPISCQFRYTLIEWQQQKEILEDIARESKQGKALKAVQYIKSFSEHPWLAVRNQEPEGRTYDSASLLASSSKFRWLLAALQIIQKKREKALIFTRSIQMQTWIHNLLKEQFGIDFEPINGAISGKKEDGSSRTTAILKRFEEHPGFAALVLSPEVAGVGLNITAANHVIHYGRWWNPAKEDQATCRAYRKGQKRNVYLYVPIGIGPNAEESFDQRLDQMLRDKSNMRQDFLTPIGNPGLSDQEATILIPRFENPGNETTQTEGREFE